MIRVTYNITPCAIASPSSADLSWFEALNLAMPAELGSGGSFLPRDDEAQTAKELGIAPKSRRDFLQLLRLSESTRG
jgi:hypothetical protein